MKRVLPLKGLPTAKATPRSCQSCGEWLGVTRALYCIKCSERKKREAQQRRNEKRKYYHQLEKEGKLPRVGIPIRSTNGIQRKKDKYKETDIVTQMRWKFFTSRIEHFS